MTASPPSSVKKSPRKSSDTVLLKNFLSAVLQTTISNPVNKAFEMNPQLLYMHRFIMHALDAGKDNLLFEALDTLWDKNSTLYEIFADHLEFCIETESTPTGTTYGLLAIPILVWSRNNLPSGVIDATSVARLSAAVKEHWIADTADLFVDNILYTPESLPEGFSETRALVLKYCEQAQQGIALSNTLVKTTLGSNDKEDNFLADTRFILAIVSSNMDNGLFKLLLDDKGEVDFEAQEHAWRGVAHEAMTAYFVGCAYDIMPPNPYYESNRAAELAIRGFSLHAAILMIMTDSEITADDLRVVIAPCHNAQFEEYRISILLKNDEDNTVLQGVTWPLLGREELQEDLLQEILAHLKTLGVHRIRLIEDAMPMEYCDDCEAPLFPDPNADMVHVGDLDDDTPSSRHIVH